jgi:hypothetical protein
MRRSRVLIGTGYGVGLLLVLLPLLQPVVTLLPAQPTQVAWRMQAFGVLSQSLLLPLVGVAVAVGTATMLEHRASVRVLAALALLGAAALAGVATLFVLDLLQYRGAIGAELQDHYHVAGVIYLVGYAAASLFLAWLGVAALRAARARRRRQPAPYESAPLPGEAAAARD